MFLKLSNCLLVLLLCLSASANAAKVDIEGCPYVRSNAEDGFPQHFISHEYYFKGLPKEASRLGGFPPHIMAKSGRGLIVVTEGLRDIFAENQGKDHSSVSAYVVLDMTSGSSASGSLSDRQLSGITHRYGLTAERVTWHLGTGWATFKLTGPSGSLFQFLGNDFAKNRVMWAGLKNYNAFATEASRWFTKAEVYQNETW